jgi:hypothetical protein
MRWQLRLFAALASTAVLGYAQMAGLPYRPVAAKYSQALDKIVMVAANPNQLHIYDPVSYNDVAVNLPKPPTSVAVSQNGLFAAVGHDGLVSYVDLTLAAVVKTLAVGATVNDLLLGSDYVYAATNNANWTNDLTYIQISTGTATTPYEPVYFTGGALTADGSGIYGTNDGFSPDDMWELTLTSGAVTGLNMSPYHGDYGDCGPVFLSQDGTRIYTACSTVYHTSTDPTLNMYYWGTLPGSPGFRSLSESSVLNRIAIIPGQPYSPQANVDEQVLMFDNRYLNALGAFQLTPFTVLSATYPSHGKWLFFNSASSSLYVVEEADSTSGLLNDFAVETIPMSNPPACSASFAAVSQEVIAAGSLGSVGIVAAPGCQYQATSNADWIQVVSGGNGSGNGTLTWIARPNTGVSRNGTITIGPQVFTINQDAVPALPSVLAQLSYNVTDVEYSKALDKMVIVSAGPNELHIYDPITGSDQLVPLVAAPLSVSVRPDGLYAAVGQDGWISLVNLQTANVEQVFQIITDVHDIILAGNGYIYAFPARAWSDIYSLQISTGTVTGIGAVYTGRIARLDPGGPEFFTGDSSWFAEWNISGGIPTQSLDGGVSACSDYWLSETGDRLITGCGNVYLNSHVPGQAPQYDGALSGAPAVQWAADSATQQSMAVIPMLDNYLPTPTSDLNLQIYGDGYLAQVGQLQFPSFSVSGTPYDAHGRFVFWNSSATALAAIVQADPTAQLASSYAVYTLPVNVPATGCSFSLGSNSSFIAITGGYGSADVGTGDGCVWESSSSASWLTVTAGGVGFGPATLQWYAAPNNTGLPRSAVITVAGQQVLIAQAGTGPPTCPTAISPNATINATAQSVTIAVTADQTCNWTAIASGAGGTITSGASGTGSGSVVLGMEADSTGPTRAVQVTIGSAVFTLTQTFTTARFGDVPPTATFFDAANLMFDAGVTTGCVAGSTPETRRFCPNDNVTREQMAAFIVRAVTGTTTPAIYNPVPYFTDVPTANLFFPHIQKMEELGITSGCATGLFCPTDNVPRWQMAIFMIRARLALYGATFATAATPYFADVPTNVEGNGQPFPFIQRSYEEHITNGCGTNPLIYCPDELVTRGQMAAFIMRGLFNETTILGPTAPQVTGVSPDTMAATVGTQITVTITGVNTNFQTGDTVAVPSGMLTVSDVVVNSATSISATLTASANVVAGPQALVVTSGGQNLTLPLAIKVGTY